MIKTFTSAILLSATLLCSLTHAEGLQENLSQSLSPHVSVTGQMSSEKFSDLIKQGFKSVIVNRPDNEPGNQTSVYQLRSLAEKSNISVIYQPVTSGKISSTDIAEFAKYYNELPKPILMVCRSGTRSTMLFNEAKKLGLLNE